jgi:hypothetical protein
VTGFLDTREWVPRPAAPFIRIKRAKISFSPAQQRVRDRPDRPADELHDGDTLAAGHWCRRAFARHRSTLQAIRARP